MEHPDPPRQKTDLRIDAHQHFWKLGRFEYDWLNDPSLAKIRRDFMPQDLQKEMQRSKVHQSVFVQTQHNIEETEWVLQLAAEYPFLVGVVGWVDLASEACEQQLLRLRENRRFVGVRHVTHDEPDDDFIVRPDVLNGLRVLQRYQVPFDLLFFVKHLKHADTLARQLPELPMVIDHLAKPQIKTGRMDNWTADFRAAARHANVYCKISGMITEADWQSWTVDQLRPYFDLALECFGVERLMFGSDWPVCCLAGEYHQVVEAVEQLSAELSSAEQQRLWAGTAQEFYRLPEMASFADTAG